MECNTKTVCTSWFIHLHFDKLIRNYYNRPVARVIWGVHTPPPPPLNLAVQFNYM